MKRYFEKISFEQFSKDIKNDKELYESYSLPKRQTKYAAGYDFYALEDFIIKPGEIKKIPTGIKSNMEDDEVLLLIVRSSMGFKYNVRLCNQVGVIDKDYYNNSDNEGHMFIALQNHGEKDYVSVYWKDHLKTSHNIIYLIEFGDYVNGYPEYDIIEYEDNTRAIVIDDDDKSIIWEESSQYIESIVTKEQMEEIQYKVV